MAIDLPSEDKDVIMSQHLSGPKYNLEHWMDELPGQLKDVPLIHLAIPGSHNAMTYGINRHSKVAPDGQPILKWVYFAIKPIFNRWAITQSWDTHQQLVNGIRYLDLRLATKNGTDQFFFTHAVYAGEISEPLQQVRDFVDSHPGEVVFLDFQHFYAFSLQDHQRLVNYLINLYGTRLAPPQADLRSITLSSLRRQNQNIIIVYRQDNVLRQQGIYLFWTSHMMPTPWPRQDKTSGLIDFITHVTRWDQGAGFVHQLVLTPTKDMILGNLISSIKKQCAVPVTRDVLPRILDFSPGIPNQSVPARLNVVIADFVDLNDGIFAKTVIHLNNKLLGNSKVVQSYVYARG